MIAEEIIEEVKDEDSGPPAKSSRIEVIPHKSTDNKQSWNKSIGVISKKPALANLVKSKKNTDTSSTNVSATSVSTDVVTKNNDTPSKVPSANGLSLLASYSGSDSDSQ